jgi:hypothetical protein
MGKTGEYWDVLHQTQKKIKNQGYSYQLKMDFFQHLSCKILFPNASLPAYSNACQQFGIWE